MNVFNIERTFRDKKEKNWEKIYFCIDLHDVIINGTYNKMNEGAQVFPSCKEFFEWAERREDIRIILWTSSYKSAIIDIIKRLRKDGINFDYINENPECVSGSLCDFSRKFYFNILLDDKAGFEGPTDWTLILNELKRIGEF